MFAMLTVAPSTVINIYVAELVCPSSCEDGFPAGHMDFEGFFTHTSFCIGHGSQIQEKDSP